MNLPNLSLQYTHPLFVGFCKVQGKKKGGQNHSAHRSKPAIFGPISTTRWAHLVLHWESSEVTPKSQFCSQPVPA